jgi:tryptophan synthase beta chain
MKYQLPPAGPAPVLSPDARGRFGDFGGRFVPETLVQALQQLAEQYAAVREDRSFWDELAGYMRDYSGRPTPLYRARRLREKANGPELYLKREDLNHTGSHKINNCLGQALLAKRLGKRTILAETGAGQHGVATATVCALLDMRCKVYMGAEDVRRQALNVRRMELLGAEVVAVESGSRTLKDATNEAMRSWVGAVDEAHYILGSVVGPHPYPWMVRDFQAVIGHEIAQQLEELPGLVVACVGGGSNAAGAFARFVPHPETRLVGVEAGGHGHETGEHCASLGRGRPGILHGALTYLLQDETGQVSETHSISAGLDYPGVGPEHSHWKASGRVEYAAVSDAEALDAFDALCRLEGIVPALESAHAVAWYLREGAAHRDDKRPWVLCLSGRGDKDVQEVLRLRGLPC